MASSATDGMIEHAVRCRGVVRSLTVNVALMRAFRRSPMNFLDVLVASGAHTLPLHVGSERVLLVDDATHVWELLTTHARRTGKGRGLVRARLLLGDGLLTSEGDAASAAPASPAAGISFPANLRLRSILRADRAKGGRPVVRRR